MKSLWLAMMKKLKMKSEKMLANIGTPTQAARAAPDPVKEVFLIATKVAQDLMMQVYPQVTGVAAAKDQAARVAAGALHIISLLL